MSTPTGDLFSPWVPMSNPLDIKCLGKLGEELGECSAIVSRCLIQGIYEADPLSGDINIHKLTEEIADVLANIKIVSKHFTLDDAFIQQRIKRKVKNLEDWHAGLEISK